MFNVIVIYTTLYSKFTVCFKVVVTKSTTPRVPFRAVCRDWLRGQPKAHRFWPDALGAVEENVDR